MFGVLALQDYPPDAGDAWVCRPNVHAPAGFTYELTPRVMAGDIQVEYEDDCPAAVQIVRNMREVEAGRV